MAARDPLKEYLLQRVQEAQESPADSGWPDKRRRALDWTLTHWERLHTAWIVSLAALVSVPVYAPYDDWKKFAALPILVLFMTPFVTLAEIPMTAALVVVVEWIRSRTAKRRKPAP